MLVYSYVLSQDNYLEIVVLQLSHQIISSVNEKNYFAEINYMLHWKGIFYILFVIILRSAQENKNSVQHKV